jgi:hypothetical protein
MTKLKLSAIPDDRPVKLTIELPGAVRRDLAAYTDDLNSQHVFVSFFGANEHV